MAALGFALPLLRGRSIHCPSHNHYKRTLEYMITKLDTDTQTIMRNLSSDYESDFSTSVVGLQLTAEGLWLADIGFGVYSGLGFRS